MSKYSSFKSHQLITENWRKFLKEGLYNAGDALMAVQVNEIDDREADEDEWPEDEAPDDSLPDVTPDELRTALAGARRHDLPADEVARLQKLARDIEARQASHGSSSDLEEAAKTVTAAEYKRSSDVKDRLGAATAAGVTGDERLALRNMENLLAAAAQISNITQGPIWQAANKLSDLLTAEIEKYKKK